MMTAVHVIFEIIGIVTVAFVVIGTIIVRIVNKDTQRYGEPESKQVTANNRKMDLNDE